MQAGRRARSRGSSAQDVKGARCQRDAGCISAGQRWGKKRHILALYGMNTRNGCARGEPPRRSALALVSLRMAKRDKEPTKKGQPSGQPAEQNQPKKPGLSEEERKEIREFLRRKRDRPHAPKARVKSARGKPLDVDFPSPVDLSRFMSVFGTNEMAFANLMLAGIVSAACEGGPENPPRVDDINRALAAVTGIGAVDEIEGMLATQMVATHAAAITALRRLKGSETIRVGRPPLPRNAWACSSDFSVPPPLPARLRHYPNFSRYYSRAIGRLVGTVRP